MSHVTNIKLKKNTILAAVKYWEDIYKDGSTKQKW